MKFHGKVGYGTSTEKTEGVWVDTIHEETYYGDVITNSRDLVAGQMLNSDVTVGNSVSILADAYALRHFHAIRYVEWAGALWTVVNVTEQRPRLILRLGGVYNGPAEASNPARNDTGQ